MRAGEYQVGYISVANQAADYSIPGITPCFGQALSLAKKSISVTATTTFCNISVNTTLSSGEIQKRAIFKDSRFVIYGLQLHQKRNFRRDFHLFWIK